MIQRLAKTRHTMDLVGPDHPNKEAAAAALEIAIARGERLVTNAEVIQELLRRYRSIGPARRGRRAATTPGLNGLSGGCNLTRLSGRSR